MHQLRPLPAPQNDFCAAVYNRAEPSRGPCRSWTVSVSQPSHLSLSSSSPASSPYTCDLRGGCSSPSADSRSISGVVYRTGVQADRQVAGYRSFNYVTASAPSDLAMWRDYSARETERDMAYAQQAGFKFARVFLSFTVWEHNATKFLGDLRHFVAAAHARGVQTMPVIFDPCFDGCKTENITIFSNGSCWYPSPNPQEMTSAAWWEGNGKAYVRSLVTALPATTPGLALWDAVNEPGHQASGLPFALKCGLSSRNLAWLGGDNRTEPRAGGPQSAGDAAGACGAARGRPSVSFVP